METYVPPPGARAKAASPTIPTVSTPAIFTLVFITFSLLLFYLIFPPISTMISSTIFSTISFLRKAVINIR